MFQMAIRALGLFLITIVLPSSFSATAPSITTNLPNSRTNRVGQNLTLSITAAGDTPLIYEWFKDNEPIPLASLESYTLSNMVLEDAGIYRVRVRNAAGTVNSGNCTVYVAIPITITKQPTNITVGQGQTARFVVETTGSGQAYQWYRGGTRITGATNSILELPNVQPTDTFSYRVTVANILGSVTSSSANLTIATLNLLSQPASQNIAVGSNLFMSVTVSGNSPQSFQWYKDGEAVPGKISSFFSTNSVQLKDTGNYWVVVSNNWLIRTSSVARIDVWAVPTFSRAPESQFAKPGDTISFAAEVTNTTPVNFQWAFNGIAIAGATNSSITISNIEAANFGLYRLTAKFPGAPIGRSISTSLNEAALQIINDLKDIAVTNGAPATFQLMAVGTFLITYYWYKNNTLLDVPSEDSLRFSAVGPEHVGNYQVILSNAWYMKTSSVARLITGDPVVITKQPPDLQTIGQGKTARFEVEAVSASPLTYQWYRRIQPIEGATNSVYEISNIDPSHTDNYWVTISNAVLGVRSVDSRLQVAVLAITQQPNSQSYHRDFPGSIELSVVGSEPITIHWFKNNTLVPDSNTNRLEFPNIQASDAGSYFAIVSNQWLVVTSHIAEIKVGTAAIFSKSPLSQNVPLGSRVEFQVEASSELPSVISYQWYLNGGKIPNATNTTYVIEKTVSADHGKYLVNAQNGFAVSSSGIATLTFTGSESWTNDLHAYYPLDGDLSDYSDLGHYLEYNENVQPAGDRWGRMRAAEFNGVNSALIRSNAVFDLGAPNYTFTLWFKTYAPQQTYQGILNSVPHNALYIVLNHPPLGSALQWVIGNGTNWIIPHQHVTNFTLTENTWRQLAFTREQTYYRLYIDGELVSEVNVPDAPFVTVASGLYLGAIGPANQPLNGAIDDFRFYHFRPMSGYEIRNLYEFEKAPDRNPIFMIHDPAQPYRYKTTGPNGVGYFIETSSDLITWDRIRTNYFTPTPFEFPADPGAPHLFFRATSPR